MGKSLFLIGKGSEIGKKWTGELEYNIFTNDEGTVTMSDRMKQSYK